VKVNQEDQKKPSPGNKVQKLKPPTPPRKARMASPDPTTVKDVLREFEFMADGPKGEAIDFSPFGYLRDDTETDRDNHIAANTAAPMYLTVDGADRVMRYFKNHKTNMEEPESVPSLMYSYRDHNIIFRIHNWEEGVQVLVLNSMTGKDISKTFDLEQRGNAFLTWIDSAINQLSGIGSSTGVAINMTP